jgi:hypothetical protein
MTGLLGSAALRPCFGVAAVLSFGGGLGFEFVPKESRSLVTDDSVAGRVEVHPGATGGVW